jgi:hypothetical protein
VDGPPQEAVLAVQQTMMNIIRADANKLELQSPPVNLL